MIKVLELQHFGQFHNKRIEIKGGLNIFYGENEKGKSTIQSFILAMFYGFSRDSTKIRLYSDDYDRYLPLQGGYYQGALEFIFENEKYRIERNFLKSNESCHVINLTTSTQVESDPSWFKYSRIPQPGAYFFKMDQHYFTNFFLLDDLSKLNLTEVESEIREQLVNLRESGDEKISLTKAKIYLDEKKGEVGTKRAKTSPLGKTLQEIEISEIKLQELKEINYRYQNLLEEDRNYTAKINQYWDLMAPLEREVKSQDQKNLEDTNKDIFNIRYQLMELMNRKINLIHIIEDLEEKNPALLHEEQQKSPLILTSVLILILFVLANKFIDFKFSIIILILGGIGIYLYFQNRNKSRVQYQEQLSALDHIIYQERDLIDQCTVCSPSMESEACMQAIDNYLSNQHQGNTIVFEKLNDYKNKIHELELQQSKIRYELDQLEAKRDAQATLNIKLNELYELRDQYLDKLQAIDTTVEILNLLSKTHAGDGYQRFEESLNRIFFRLTNGKYSKVYLNEDEKIYVQSNEQLIVLSQLSRGTKDQLFLSIRLALLEINQTEEIPLVIDDSLVHFDNNRLKNVLNYLTKLQRQILLFSAHSRELDIINREGFSAHRVDW